MKLSIDEAIQFCKEKSKNIKLKAEPQVFVEIAEKLEELKICKDLEEQGLLLKLPCKVGDKAYYLHKGGIDEVEVDSFVLNINLFVNISYYIGCDRFGKTLTPYKTLFFTREEAEQALERIKNKNEM